MLDALVGFGRGGLGLLALADVAPGADDLGRLAVPVADQTLLVDDPAIATGLPEEPIFDGVAARLEQTGGFRLDLGEIVGMHRAPPEIGILQILRRFVAEPVPEVLADERRPEVAGGLV